MSVASQKPVAIISPNFQDNVSRISEVEINKHRGRFVAFSLDGRKILASAESMEHVETILVGMGIDPSQVVGSYLDPPDVDAHLGGLWDCPSPGSAR
jgi:hypothetical protein